METDNEGAKTPIDVKSQVTLSTEVSAREERLENRPVDDMRNDEATKIDDSAEEDEKDAEEDDSLEFIENQKKRTNDSILTKNG